MKKLDALLLPNLFPRLARRSVSAPFGLNGFDSAAPRAPEKSKVGEVNLEVSSRIVFNFKP